MKENKQSFKITPEQLQVLQNKLENNINEILQYFNVNLNSSYKSFYGACPVHGGDNKQALNVYRQHGDKDIFHWKCYTQHCESHFKKTIIGFIRGLLSHNKYNWSRPGDKEISFSETLKWCFEFLGEKPEDLKFDQISEERRKFIQTYSEINKPDYPFYIEKQAALDRLTIPSSYFLERGFEAKILEKYGVGDSKAENKDMANRAIVPVWSDCGKYCVGCIGRSKLEKCEKCKLHHTTDSKCPTNYLPNFCKWKERNFNKKNSLYNYCFAKDFIKKYSCVVLVEGAGSVWKLEEAGIHVSLGTYGAELFDEQKILLDKLSPINVIIITDNDEAGDTARFNWRNKLRRYYNVYDYNLEEVNDLGELNRKFIEDKVKPFIESKYKVDKTIKERTA